MNQSEPDHVAANLKDESPIGVGVIGVGFMGQTHIRAFRSANEAGFPCRLEAVCDSSEVRRSGIVESSGNLSTNRAREDRLFNPEVVHTYTTAAELVADVDVDLVSICTHTDSHVDLAMTALEAGKHVIVEKPVALKSGDVERLSNVAAAVGKLCMPAMCMRFWPGWDYLKQCVDDNRFGAVRSATFHRLAAPPGWASEFYLNPTRSGGALFDLHIHDADFILYLLGKPDSVMTLGDEDHVTSLYQYDPLDKTKKKHDGSAPRPHHVVAEGGWDHAPGFPFRMRYVVMFENATVDFDLARKPRLQIAREGSLEPVEISNLTGYEMEVRHLLQSIHTGKAESDLRATMDQAIRTCRLLESEKHSMETRRLTPVNW